MAADDISFIDLRPDNPGEDEARRLVLSLVAQALPVVLAYPHSA
jgi:hypothetical protein